MFTGMARTIQRVNERERARSMSVIPIAARSVADHAVRNAPEASSCLQQKSHQRTRTLFRGTFQTGSAGDNAFVRVLLL